MLKTPSKFLPTALIPVIVAIVLATLVSAASLNQQHSESEDIHSAIRMLHSAAPADQQLGATSLLRLARTSTRARRSVIKALITTLEQHVGPGRRDITFSGWWDVATLLGELKANEAIVPLVSTIATNPMNLGSLSLTFFPAAKALTEIGKPAVPQLAHLVLAGDNRSRGLAAQCLGEIGGDQAIAALKAANAVEHDPAVKYYIEINLHFLDRDR